MTTALAPIPEQPASMDLSAIERVVVLGDLGKLTAEERWAYYRAVCLSVGLNPMTQPFLYITLSGKLVLYATKGAADQLRDNHHISISQPRVDLSDGLCIVTVTATDRSGRTDSDLGIVPCENLRGDAKANAILKAVTKAKRRVTLSMCGLGMLDETEVEAIPNVQPVDFPAVPVAAIEAPTQTADETRAKFESNWTKCVARAIACGIAPDDKPGPDATKAELRKAQADLLEAIQAREKLNAELTSKIAAVRAAGGDIADMDPTTCTDTEVHESISSLNEMLAPPAEDDSDAPF